jgi:serine/threonine protein kinase
VELAADAPDGLCANCLAVHAEPTRDVPRETPTYSTPFTAPQPSELAEHFPQIEILGLLGQGGMGAVYKARQSKLDRLIALKVLPPEAGKDPSFAERFTREARALARLNHPNIVTVYDFGQVGDLCYFMMEYVDGLNLRRLLQSGRMQSQEALKIVPQICDALQFAHDEGIVHRDVKPENILLDKRGRVKIADFGIAKILGRNTGIYTLTGPWQVVGTLHYMAPEQIDNPLKVDHRADIYSLGVVFYEMLTGQLPLGRFAPPSQKAVVDARLDHVVLRALENEPDRRYQHASEVKTEVEAITLSGPAQTLRTPQLPVAAKGPTSLAVKCSMFLGMWDAPGLLRLEGENLLLEVDAGITKSKYRDIEIPLQEIESLRLNRKWFKGVLTVRGRRLRSLSHVPGHQEGRVEFEVAGEDYAAAELFVASMNERLSGAPSIVPSTMEPGQARGKAARIAKPALRFLVRGGMSFVRQIRTLMVAHPEPPPTATRERPDTGVYRADAGPVQYSTPPRAMATPQPSRSTSIPFVLPAPDVAPLVKPEDDVIANARRWLRWPARLLFCVGVFNTLALIPLVVLAIVSTFSDSMQGEGQTFRWLSFSQISGPFLIWASMRMPRLLSYRLCVLAAVLSFLSPLVPLGIPTGILALRRLGRDDVKRAFDLQSDRRS